MNTFLKRHLSKLILMVVAGYCVFYAVAFVRLYSMEHPYVVASQWIFDNVPPGSRIAAPHWDDKVPVSIRGRNASEVYITTERELELPVYERDTPQILEGLARKIAGADYITFATPRAPDSIPRIPEEYPNTTALIRLLWGEKLGFQLVYSVKNRPSLLGVTFNDDLADESFSVYDHPKVTVFRNVGRLSKDEIIARVQGAQSFEPLPSMDEILLMDRGGWQPMPRLWQSEWNGYLIAVALVGVLGMAVWCLLAPFMARLPDGGLGMAPMIAALSVGLMCQGAVMIGLLPLSAVAGRLVFFGILLLAILRLFLRPSERGSLLAPIRSHGMYVLVAYLGGAALVAIMRSGDTGFFGLGDQVEQTYLVYLARNRSLPLYDVLNPGATIPWYQLDRIVMGWLLKISGTSVAHALDVALMISGALVGGLLYTLSAALCKRPRMSLMAAGLAIIPMLYVFYAVRTSSNERLAELLAVQERPELRQVVAWANQNVSLTPRVVEACDEAAVRGIAASMGLPVYRAAATGGSLVEEATQELCSARDPDYTFQTMRRHGLELFITAGGAQLTTQSAMERLAMFGARADLFSKVYDDGSFVIFAPAFSSYFRLAQ